MAATVSTVAVAQNKMPRMNMALQVHREAANIKSFISSSVSEKLSDISWGVLMEHDVNNFLENQIE